MKKALKLAAISTGLAFVLSGSAFAAKLNPSTITVENHTKASTVQLIVKDTYGHFVASVPLNVSDEIGPENWVSYWSVFQDAFDKIEVYYSDPDQGWVSCGNIEADPIPTAKDITRTYTIVQCDGSSPQNLTYQTVDTVKVKK